MLAEAIAVVNLELPHKHYFQFWDKLLILSKLSVPVDAFFDKVKVNADSPAVRENRLRLLSALRASLHTVSDFSKIEG